MIVYGDRARTVEVGPELEQLRCDWDTLLHTLEGPDRHGRLCAVFIGVAELLQGVGDEAPDAEPAFLALCMSAAQALRRSWDGEDAEHCPEDLFAAASAVAPERVTVRTAEGYAFYALYPEAYREAARGLAPDVRVIGLRSIGAGLACAVAEAAGAAAPLTVRPGGHPFQRTVALPAVDPAATYAVVDEGPGLSGSSFGAVADALEAQGVASDRIVFLPGHGGDLGRQASTAHRTRWAAAERRHVGFETLIAPRLAGWVEDLTGAVESETDLSGGAWRRLAYGEDEAGWPPSAAHQERRKILVRSGRGAFLLKFVGLGAFGMAALERARALHAAGFAPKPLGWRHGFLVERWIDSRPLTPADRPRLLETLERYLAFRAEAFPAGSDAGARLGALAEMARANVGEALGGALADRLPEPPSEAGPRVGGDHRLHAWEWRATADGRLFKTDGVDHAFGHDLVGCQPADWDRAGALVEHGFRSDAPLHPFWPAAYAGFQLGLWTMAAEALAGWPAESGRCRAQGGRYAEWLRTSL